MKQTIARILPFFLIFSILLSSCAAASSPSRQEASSDYTQMPAMEVPAAMPEAYPSFGGTSEYETGFNAVPGQPAPQERRIVIKNANLSIVVADPPASVERISKMAEDMGGFVVSANVSETQLESGVKVPRGSLMIRVPAERLNEARDKIRAESDRLPLSDQLDSQDVTREYTDLESRLRNLEAAEKQLTSILQEARRTEDVLSVYNQLVQVREQIEVIKGQIKYYDQSSALSAISVELLANEAVQPLTIGGWEPAGVARDAIQSLIDSLKFLASAGIWVVLYLLPVLLILYLVFILPLTLLVRALRRRAKNRSTILPPAQPPVQPGA